jgi:hypothetical protein
MKQYSEHLKDQQAKAPMRWDELHGYDPATMSDTDVERVLNEAKRLMGLLADAYQFVGRKPTTSESKARTYRTLMQEATYAHMGRKGELPTTKEAKA